MIAYCLPSEIAAYPTAYGRQTGQGIPDDARDAILDHLEDHADLERAAQWRADMKAAQSDCVPLDDLLARYT